MPLSAQDLLRPKCLPRLVYNARLSDFLVLIRNCEQQKKAPAQPENVSLGPQVREGESYPSSSCRPLLITYPGELVFGVARIFASFNDTFVHVTDLRFV